MRMENLRIEYFDATLRQRQLTVNEFVCGLLVQIPGRASPFILTPARAAAYTINFVGQSWRGHRIGKEVKLLLWLW
jgi:hypothetical protein